MRLTRSARLVQQRPPCRELIMWNTMPARRDPIRSGIRS
jgi:hypothetical protein